MTKKVFISYSHKDEEHRKDLEEHLTMLKRKNIISIWHDRAITAGEDWKNEIDENLNQADIIIFLVSSSFLASDYCYDIEMAKAIEKQNNKTAMIISILVRPCDWQSCDLSRFQAVPTDVKPITTWEDKDTAWLDTINGIKAHISKFTASKNEAATTTYPAQKATTPTNQILKWADDTEIVLTNRKVSQIKLSDVYVIPDMETENDVKPDELIIKSTEKIIEITSRYILSGEEQQGKTSLLKFYFTELLKKEYLPIYLDATKIKESDILQLIGKLLTEQYVGLDLDSYIKNPKRVLLIDNVDEIALNTKFRNIFLNRMNELFSFTILTCHNSFYYILGEIPSLDEHKRCEILGLGNKKREEIVQKWISLGIEESINETEMYTQCDDLKARLNAVIKKNIVPPKPIYVLMFLQMFEAHDQLNLELTSYGHCYQQLIYQSFENAKISKPDVGKYLNVLTELAWWIFLNNTEPNADQLTKFFDSYCETYLSVDRELVVRKMTTNSILAKRGFLLGFKYPYIYYFFVGKKIAESYNESTSTKESITKLINHLHREDYANILIFITHHTKEAWVISEIKSILNSLFNDQDMATLNKKELSFMEDFMKQIPDLVLEQREIQKVRDEHNQKLDDLERNNKEEQTEPLDILANINKTFKGMEIAGQIIRNRHANLSRNALTELANCGVSSGLRFLDYFIKISDATKNETLKLITNHLSISPNLTDQEIEKYAEQAYLHLTYGVINAVIRKISSSIGSKEALEIYSALEQEKGTPAVTLIKQAIELQFNKSLRIDHVSKTVEKIHENPVCMRILKEMVIQHIYMFPVDFKEKQQLSTLLKIPVQQQRLMDREQRKKG